MPTLTDRSIYVTANGLNKSLKAAIQAGDIGGGGGGGGAAAYELFNATIQNATGATSLTGVAYFKVPANMSVTLVTLSLYTKGGISTGSLTMDLKKNSTPDNVGMTSIFDTLPTLNLATAADYATNAGVLNATNKALTAGQWVRLDLTSIPAGLSSFYVSVYGA